MTILFAGGGTLGPVTPLLAVWDRLREKDVSLEGVWLGTPNGPERELVLARGFSFTALPVAKIPRFFSLDLLAFPWQYARGWFRARRVLRKVQPALVVSAGGFTAVPVIRAAGGLGIPCMAHQLDFLPGLANRVSAHACALVTTSFTYDNPLFSADVTTEALPTPVQFSLERLPSRSQALRELRLDPKKPTIMVLGGGTGARALNQLVEASYEAWLARGWQIIHLTGKGKNEHPLARVGVFQRELCLPQEMMYLYGAADIVVCRAGMGTISEVVALRKPAIMVPIPGSHQEANARPFAQAEAAIVLDERDPSFASWVEKAIERYIRDAPFARLSTSRAQEVLPTDHGEALADAAYELATAQEASHEHTDDCEHQDEEQGDIHT